MTALETTLEEGQVPVARPGLVTARRYLAERGTIIGIVITGLVLLVALIGPLVAPHGPTDIVAAPFAPPSGDLPLGADYLGRDVLSRVLAGGLTLLWMSLAAAIIGVGVGALIGLSAGYGRKGADFALMRPLEIIQSLPQVVLVLLFVSMLGPKLWLIVVLVAVAWLSPAARLARGLTLEVASKEYVEAAEVLGIPRRRILFREILPNLTTPLLIELGIRITFSIGLIAAVSFLGFGVQAPNTDWGLMINENRTGLAIQPYAVVLPILCIAVFTIGTNLITEGIARTMARVQRRASS